ncbi:MAG TPA: outer membrane lipoprotein carrier protein LolA [Candidatus Sulfotelmatobacter sp.]|nr:outer membrane lipoprotein carrier protein LolA [Candidatus Sulfotelmatobacter sp.]
MRNGWIFALALLAFSSESGRRAEQLARAIETRYRHATTLKAAFFERFTDGSGIVASESGTVYFSRPGRMRWDYESPEPKLFLVDGANVWFYVPADRTASRAKLKESSDWRTPLALLTGKADFAHLCRVLEVVPPNFEQSTRAEAADSAPGNSLLRCVPRFEADPAGNALHDILFESDSQAHLVRVVIREAGNVSTEFRFGAWEENLPLPEAKFHFSPPPGVTIVDEQTLASHLH